MCGIVGIFNTDRKPVSRHVLKKMSDMIIHRGPDNDGFWFDTYVGFGHRRLSIIDLSPLGNQPMISDDGRYVIVYNGEVYNYQNLQIELKTLGYKFYSKTDTEVVLKSYMEWGAKAVEKFNGMFAFAIWDNMEKKLFIARDRYGIKPLYYYQEGNIFLFASEIKAFTEHPNFNVRVNTNALNEYFSFQNIFSDLTLFNGVKLLPGGYYAYIEIGSTVKKSLYWDFNFKEDSKIISENVVQEELIYLFRQAVNRQLVSDVEIGAYLSGGMDSGLISFIAAESLKNIKSFTCGFDLSSANGLELSFDERAKAEYLSNLLKTEHYQVVLKAGDMERIMDKLVWHIEDLRVGQSYPNYYVSRLASKFVKVVLSGTGGDEIFAGYPWRYYRAVVNDDFEHYSNKYYKYWQRLIPDSMKSKFFLPEFYNQFEWDYSKDIFKRVLSKDCKDNYTPEEYINHSLYFECKTFLHGLLMVDDKLSMANSLEARIPFLDNDLVDFAMKIPVKLKLKNLKEIVRLNENEPGEKTEKYYNSTGDGKLIIRNLFKQFVPYDYTNGIKQGFSAPDASWFKGESIDYIKQLLSNKSASIYNYIQYETAQSYLNAHFLGKKNNRLLIWSMLCFEKWLEVFNVEKN
jgi:asparagine synthase (glutamine-hydrolysing)